VVRALDSYPPTGGRGFNKKKVENNGAVAQVVRALDSYPPAGGREFNKKKDRK